MKPIFEKIKQNGDIRLPKSILVDLNLKTGEKIMLSVRDREILIKPVKPGEGGITKRITGSIKPDNPRLIDEIIESEDWI